MHSRNKQKHRTLRFTIMQVLFIVWSRILQFNQWINILRICVASLDCLAMLCISPGILRLGSYAHMLLQLTQQHNKLGFRTKSQVVLHKFRRISNEANKIKTKLWRNWKMPEYICSEGSPLKGGNCEYERTRETTYMKNGCNTLCRHR